MGYTCRHSSRLMVTVGRTVNATLVPTLGPTNWLHLGCISRRDLPRFAGVRCRNIEDFGVRRALRNQQVAGSSPAAGSSYFNYF